MNEDESKTVRVLAALVNELEHGQDIAGLSVAVLFRQGGTLRHTIMDETRGNVLTLAGAALTEAVQLAAQAVLSATTPPEQEPVPPEKKGPAAVLSLIRGGKPPEPPAEG